MSKPAWTRPDIPAISKTSVSRAQTCVLTDGTRSEIEAVNENMKDEHMTKKFVKSHKSNQPWGPLEFRKVDPAVSCPFLNFLRGWHARPKAERSAEEDCALLLLAHILWASRELVGPSAAGIELQMDDLKQLGISSESECVAGLKVLVREGIITRAEEWKAARISSSHCGQELVWRPAPKNDRKSIFLIHLPWVGARPGTS